MQKLKNKVAVITGGSIGIGFATTKRFIAEGARVVITGRNQKALDTAIVSLGSSAISIQGDLSSLADLTRIFQTVAHTVGKADILVVNTGVYVIAPLADFTEEMFDKVIDINFKGAFFTVQKALPVLNDGASVILISSTVNEKGIPNTLSPGPVDTPVFETVTGSSAEAKAIAEAKGNFTPLKRLGMPEEIAGAAVYLASDESAFMLGAEVLLDGGLRDL